jgi:serine/threonine protein kinase
MAADDAGLAGQLIASRYRIGNHIGEGGMGVVYAAFDEQLRRQIAVKLLPSASQADGDSLGRFRNEARTLSALNHRSCSRFCLRRLSGEHAPRAAAHQDVQCDRPLHRDHIILGASSCRQRYPLLRTAARNQNH